MARGNWGYKLAERRQLRERGIVVSVIRDEKVTAIVELDVFMRGVRLGTVARVNETNRYQPTTADCRNLGADFRSLTAAVDALVEDRRQDRIVALTRRT